MVTPHSPLGLRPVLPDILRVDMEGQVVARYAIVRSNWQYLDAMRQWNEFE
jgi:hypothetical protein